MSFSDISGTGWGLFGANMLTNHPSVASPFSPLSSLFASSTLRKISKYFLLESGVVKYGSER